MFSNTSNAVRTAETLRTALEGWRSTADSWFDGTPGSISSRVAGCDRLIHQLRQAGPGYHGTIAEMASTRSQLADMRNSLLHQANQDRDAGHRQGAAADARHVNAARAFVRENIEAAHVPEELQIRAARHADLHSIDSSFVATVLRVAAALPRPQKTASAPTSFADFDDQLMFL